MDELTRERYTNPWWTTTGDTDDGPTALTMPHEEPTGTLLQLVPDQEQAS